MVQNEGFKINNKHEKLRVHAFKLFEPLLKIHAPLRILKIKNLLETYFLYFNACTWENNFKSFLTFYLKCKKGNFNQKS